MTTSRELKQALENNGYSSKEEYLQELAEENGFDIDTVYMVADLLGDSELFDGLVTALQDY